MHRSCWFEVRTEFRSIKGGTWRKLSSIVNLEGAVAAKPHWALRMLPSLPLLSTSLDTVKRASNNYIPFPFVVPTFAPAQFYHCGSASRIEGGEPSLNETSESLPPPPCCLAFQPTCPTNISLSAGEAGHSCVRHRYFGHEMLLFALTSYDLSWF